MVSFVTAIDGNAPVEPFSQLSQARFKGDLWRVTENGPGA
jgi:hypothetical protein